MKRDEFLKTLRKRLSFLNKQELEKEMLYYINEIDKSKKSDEEVIKSFGSIEDIVKKVSEAHGIEYKRVAKRNYFEWFQNFYDQLLDLSNIFKKSDTQKRTKLIIDLLFLIAITCILKIPFIFVRDLGDNLIGILFISNINVLAIWGLAIEIIYVVVALSFFMKTLKKWIHSIG